MKKSILLCIIFFGMQFQSQAQNTPLNKQQTLDYISKLYKATYTFKDFKVDNLNLDEKMLTISFNDGSKGRYNLMDYLTVTIKKDNDNQFYLFSSKIERQILVHIQTEADANRLKKALEHLIEVLKTEKNTDPFGE